MAGLVVNERHPLPSVLRRLCEISADTLGVERVGVWLLAAGRGALRCVNLFERSRREHSEGVTLHVADFPGYFREVGGRRVLPVEMAQTDPRTAELRAAYLVPLGISSMLDAPVLLRGEVAGVVCHEQVGPAREWTTEDRDFAMSVADAVAAKMKAAELLIATSALRHRAELVPAGDRLEAVGRVAAEVAHEFRNLLTVVLGNADLIAARPDLPPDVAARAAQIAGAAEHGAHLVRDLLDFGRPPNGAPVVLVLADAVERFVPFLRTAAGAAHPVALTRGPDGGRVLIDRANLERALLNLVLNARDAMPGGGPVGLHVAGEQAAEDGGPAGAYVRVDVSDAGPGIPPADRERVFEPFVTTKPRGKGTGLGLAVVRRVVDRAGGFIRVDSEVGRGTTVRLYFPRVTGSEE
jgi:signal transduction histidine kinase